MINFVRRDRLLALFEDPVEKLWSFVFAMGFIFILRASRYIMAVRICVVSPFLFSKAMIYYGPQSDIRIKTLAHRNSPETSMLNFERRDRLFPYLEIRRKSYGRLYLGWASFLS